MPELYKALYWTYVLLLLKRVCIIPFIPEKLNGTFTETSGCRLPVCPVPDKKPVWSGNRAGLRFVRDFKLFHQSKSAEPEQTPQRVSSTFAGRSADGCTGMKKGGADAPQGKVFILCCISCSRVLKMVMQTRQTEVLTINREACIIQAPSYRQCGPDF